MDAESMEKRCLLPYGVDYAKSDRSTCKGCRGLIEEEKLRLSARQPSTFFDGLQDNWFHFDCFWKKLKFGLDDISESSIKGVDWLKWEDQEKVREKIAEFKKGPTARIYPIFTSNANALYFKDVKFHLAPTSRGKCTKCQLFFQMGETKCHYRSKYLHAKCLFSQFKKFVGDYSEVPSLESIGAEQRGMIVKAFEERQSQINENTIEKKIEVISISPEPSTSNLMSSSSDQENSKRHLEDSQEDEKAKKRRLDMEQKKAQKAAKKLKEQADKMWELRQFFNKMSEHDRKLILKQNGQNVPSGAEAVIEKLVDISLFGVPAPCRDCQNGQLFYSSSFKTYSCSGYATEYSKCVFSDRNPLRTPFSVPVSITRSYDMTNIHFNDMVDRLYPVEEEVASKTTSFKYLGAQRFKQNVADEVVDPTILTLPKKGQVSSANNRQIIKKGTVVDSDFPYAETCHVYKDENGLFSATLTFTDLMCNKNSFHKIQLLKDDFKDVFYLFTSWGRVGTNVGNHTTKTYWGFDDARVEFEKLFTEKTKNEWKFRKHFRKHPGSYSYIETDYSEFEELGNTEILPGSTTTLPKPVKELIMSIFNTDNMKLAMQSFEMDLNKLPLGKLSKNQITSAYTVLSELQDLITALKHDEIKLYGLTNKFYTIIPHNFGMGVPEPIDSFKKIKEKVEMLDMLAEIQFAYEQVKGSEGLPMNLNCDPVDVHYKKLKCDLEPLDPTSDDYLNIVQFMNNTQGSTHITEQKLIDVIKVNRHGENEKFMKSIGNRMLLWHGSGKMNFAGILGQGLRIAPPEAPVSGYMFGKGVYFADMFSKSLFYCRTGVDDEAYLLLCDVALGKQYECTHSMGNIDAKFMKTNSCQSVKGVGREFPSSSHMHRDGYQIPRGKAMINKSATNLSLLYNEYIVYNTDQIAIRYLLRIRVKSARRL